MSSKPRILLISPRTYNYHSLIVESCKKLSFDVHWLDERPYTNLFYKLVSRYSNSFARYISILSYKRKISQLIESGFHASHVLVVKGESVHPSVIKYLRSCLPSAVFSLYFWDSTDNLPGFQKLISYFDTVSSFDYNDCKLYNWRYRPLFCGNAYTPNSSSILSKLKLYNWSFVGAVHSDRLPIFNKLVTTSSGPFFLYLYLPSFLHLIIFLFRYPISFIRLRAFLHLSPISSSHLSDIYIKSHAVVDVNHPRQVGLTIRSLETLLSGTKLYTSNPSIISEPIYCSTRVNVFDRNVTTLPLDFIRLPFDPIPSSLVDYYSCDTWLLDLLGFPRQSS